MWSKETRTNVVERSQIAAESKLPIIVPSNTFFRPWRSDTMIRYQRNSEASNRRDQLRRSKTSPYRTHATRARG
jgi:hypothetical protein